MISVRREVVEFFKSQGHSERHACVLAGLGRSTCRYRHRRRDPAELVARLRELAAAKPRYGYRFLHTLLRREGRQVNHKRVYRLYRAEGLMVRRRKRRRLRVSRPLPSVALVRPNERWSMDFVHDYLSDGRRFRTLNATTSMVERDAPVGAAGGGASSSSSPFESMSAAAAFVRAVSRLERSVAVSASSAR